MEKSVEQEFTIKVALVEVEGTAFTALDVPVEMLDAMKLVDNELLKAKVDADGNVTIVKTGAIYNT